MSEANPTPTTEDPPPLVNGESAASDKKNNAEMYGPEESREVAVTSNNADEVKNGCENGTEGTSDEDTNIVEAGDTNGGDSGCGNMVGAEDIKMVDTQHEANIEAVDVKMVDTQHEADVEAADVKMVDTQYEADVEAEHVKMVDTQHEADVEAEDVKMVGTRDVKMVHTQHEANIEAEEDACQDKEGKNGDNQHTKVTEGEDIKMVEAKADARNSEAQDRKEDVCQEKNHTNIEDKGMKMVDKEDACHREDKEGKNEDCQDAKVAEADEMKIVEAKTDARNAEVGNRKKEEMNDKVEEKKNNANIEDDDVKTVDKEFACQKEDEGNNEDSHDAKVAEGDGIEMVLAKTDAGNAEVEENGKKEEKAEKTEEEKHIANIETQDLIVLGKDDAYRKEDKKVNNEDIQDAKEADGEDMKIVEGRTDARIAEVIENRKKGQMDDNAEEKKNDASIEAENVIMIDKENACQNKDKEGKTDDSQDGKEAEGKDIKTVEAKSDAGNAGLKENGKKEEKEEQNEEKANDVNNQPDEVRIIDKEDACQKEDKERKNEDEVKIVDKEDACQNEDKERKNEDGHGAKASEGEEIMVVEAKSVAVHAEVKEYGNKEEDENKTEEKRNVNKEESKCVEKQDEDKMEPAEVDTQEMDNREQIGVEKQDGLKAEEKGGVDKHEVSDREESVKESQEVLKGEAKDNVGKQEVDDREQNVKEKQDGLEEEERVGSSKYEVAKDEQGGAAEKQEGQKNGTKRSNTDMEEAENGSASKKEKDDEAGVEEVGESDKNMEENKDEAPKSKKARIDREEDHEKDKKQDSSKSWEAKDLLNTPSSYSLDRPARARKTVERLVEVIEKELSGSFIVEKGRGIPLKNIPGVSYRIARKKPADLKFLHQILFGRFGKAADFRSHILEFSGFVWHESDEKHRAKAKEKLDKCSEDTLFDLCNLLAIPVSRVNSKKEDIVTKMLNFIAEPHANDDSRLSDDQGSNSRKRKREGGTAAKNPEGAHKRSRKKLDDQHTSRKRQRKYSELESDEEGAEEGHEEDELMKSDSEENKDDGEEADGEQEDSYDFRKVKANKKSMEGKGSTAKRKAITGSVPKTAPLAALSKCSSRVSSSSKISKDKQSSAENSNSRKSKPITPKRTANSQKEANERRSSGKGLRTSKGKSAEAEKALPSKDELQNTIVGILKKVDFNTATYSDILKMLDEHYKMDLSSRKEAIKHMVYDELIKLAEADED